MINYSLADLTYTGFPSIAGVSYQKSLSIEAIGISSDHVGTSSESCLFLFLTRSSFEGLYSLFIRYKTSDVYIAKPNKDEAISLENASKCNNVNAINSSEKENIFLKFIELGTVKLSSVCLYTLTISLIWSYSRSVIFIIGINEINILAMMAMALSPLVIKLITVKEAQAIAKKCLVNFARICLTFNSISSTINHNLKYKEI